MRVSKRELVSSRFWVRPSLTAPRKPTLFLVGGDQLESCQPAPEMEYTDIGLVVRFSLGYIDLPSLRVS